MAISTERMYELIDLYAALKVRVLKIDEKYSLDYVEPDLDLPDSLNLQKLEFTPKTEEELRALAEQSVAATFLSKQASIDKAYATKLNSVASKLALNDNSAATQLDKLVAQYEQNCDVVKKKAMRNGLVFSNVTDKYLSLELESHTKRVLDKTAEFNRKSEVIMQEQSDAENAYQQSREALEQEKQARIVAAYQKLLDAQEKERLSIEKYNNGLEEKEQKYQASRARTYEAARRAAYNRAFNNAKLYAEMGETGFRQLIMREKYYVCQDAFFPLRREEAQAILTFDSFLQSHLAIYYDSFVAWINTTLLP